MEYLKFKAVAKRNPRAPEEAAKFYASAIHTRKVGVKELAFEISERCTLRESDVQGVLIALMQILPKEICKGNIVSLGELGSFYVNISSEGAVTSEELTVTNVKGYKVIHFPTKELKSRIRTINVSKVEEPN
ncbi:MAG: HU family DNA-binding protein [Prolixibacteraceae bacterium]